MRRLLQKVPRSSGGSRRIRLSLRANSLGPIVDRPPSDHPRRAPGIEANEAQGRVVLVRPDGGFYLLDEWGALIWGLCDGARSVDDVIFVVAERTERTTAAVAGDVREWLAELREEGLLEPAPERPDPGDEDTPPG